MFFRWALPRVFRVCMPFKQNCLLFALLPNALSLLPELVLPALSAGMVLEVLLWLQKQQQGRILHPFIVPARCFVSDTVPYCRCTRRRMGDEEIGWMGENVERPWTRQQKRKRERTTGRNRNRNWVGAHTHTRTHKHTHTQTRIHIHTVIHTHTHIHTYSCTCTFMHQRTHTTTFPYGYAQTHTQTQTQLDLRHTVKDYVNALLNPKRQPIDVLSEGSWNDAVPMLYAMFSFFEALSLL